MYCRCVGGTYCDSSGAAWPGCCSALPPAGGLWWCIHHLLLLFVHPQLVPASVGGAESGAAAGTQNQSWWVPGEIGSWLGIGTGDGYGRWLAAAQQPPEVRHSSVLLQPQPGGGGGELEQHRTLAGLTGRTSPGHLISWSHHHDSIVFNKVVISCDGLRVILAVVAAVLRSRTQLTWRIELL